ncbi:MAG TPA: hypothetical protein VI874_01300 [Candidatus Norongarragalinales archaeon]|nr:hypothetical protein [Candidatus Norongarragalinales archaeon]
MKEKDWFVLAAALILLLGIGSFGMMGMSGFGCMYGLWMGFPLLGTLVFLGLLWVVFKSGNGSEETNSAKSILKTRLAKGELKLKEYERLIKEVDG